MTTIEVITAIGVAQVPCLALIAWVVRWLSGIQAKANRALAKSIAIEDARKTADDARKAEMAVYDQRLRKAEDTSSAVTVLAESIKHLGEMTTSEIKHLTERMNEHNAYIKEQLLAIKEQVAAK